MKKQWFEPKIVEVLAKMTKEEVKGHGTGDSTWEGLPLNDWHDCCCS